MLGVTHMHTHWPRKQKKDSEYHIYTHSSFKPYNNIGSRPTESPWGVKSKQGHGAGGAPLLFQLSETGEEERKVCLTKLPITGKIIKNGNVPNQWFGVTIV